MGDSPCRYVYRKHLTRTVSDTTQEDIDDSKVRPGWLLTVNHLSIEDRTTAYTRLVIGISDGHGFDEMEEEDGPLVDDIYWSKSLIIVPEGWFIRFRLMAASSSDIVNAFIQGMMERVR